MRKFIVLGFAVILAVVAGLIFTGRDSQPDISQVTTSSPKPAPDPAPEPAFDKLRHSTAEAASLWVIVNKQNPLRKGYVPNDLRAPDISLRLARNHEQMQVRGDAATALEHLFTAAEQAGLLLTLSSAYRSESLQAQFYNDYVRRDGVELADTYSAKPGASEHQTGLAADIIPRNDACHLEVCFGDLPEGKWLATNAHKHGFIIRYPRDKQTVTGYNYEPWHIRYVGIELAAELQRLNQTMEEFFSVQ